MFVSHRQTDAHWARIIAYEANQLGFDFWLDVIDLAAAKTNLADATTLWGKAQAAFSANNVEEAVNAAKEVKAKAEAAAAALKMKLPGAAPAAG